MSTPIVMNQSDLYFEHISNNNGQKKTNKGEIIESHPIHMEKKNADHSQFKKEWEEANAY